MWPEIMQCKWTVGICTAIAGLGTIFITRKINTYRKRKMLRKKYDSVGKDVVYLHQFWRGKYCINLSPFAIKVETFLRLAKIEYVVDHDWPFGPKSKCPWITLNGEDTGDSELILEKLKKHFNVDLDSQLTNKEKAILETIRITADEYVFWFVITWRYWLDGCVTFLKSQSFPGFMQKAFPLFMKRGIQMKAVAQGIGIHTEDQIYEFAKKACHTLSDALGDDPFFGGDQPATADCAVFGQLAQLKWNAPGSHYEALVTEVYPSLGRYCDRMKDTIYPDWDKLLNPPQA